MICLNCMQPPLNHAVPGIYWWLGLNAAKQAACAAVAIGLAAAFGGFAAAWASYRAAEKALRIAKEDREFHTRDRQQDANAAN
ncbi:hypothetical protein ACFFJT_17710 [Dyella flava]|uniref:Uncharacterized protein n=1 Tax=Dyella flava TaxID=1920170 RepID=A0ABS2K3D5_9GAMM|nr:hypothetical protein [Dyella flava]MBM7125649.1 hypothetical protein [Dyella flava]GLQ48837.1 hypothetical protein GCM10010872_02860 [Dyella flava]